MGSISTPLLFVQAANATVLTLGLYIGGTLTINDYSFIHADYTDINYVVSWDKTNFTLEILDALTLETIMTQTVAGATALENSSSSTGVIVYGYNFNNASAIFSTDLKQTSFKNNGVPVFSGNKTGTDTIISDNYTVVGSPTIVDGIASGFALTNISTQAGKYVTTGNFLNNLGNANSWEIEIPITLRSTISGTVYDCFMSSFTSNNSTYAFLCALTSAGKLTVYIMGADNNWILYGKTTTSTFNGGDSLIYRLKFTGTQYSAETKKTGEDWVNEFTVDSTKKMLNTNLPIKFGVRNDLTTNETFWKGSIDLNSIKIKENGKITYLTNLFVPYTESSTGSKVADSVYYNSVQAVYDLNGKALYYIIDETNKKAALPLGEVYGFITQNAKDIETKAELDFSNISSTGIETALGWGMPDTANRVLVNSGVLTTEVSYTAPSKGYIAPNFVNFHSAYLKINDVGIYNETFTVSNGHSKTIIGFIPVEKNDVIKAYSDYNQASYGDQEIYFYPMKGV